MEILELVNKLEKLILFIPQSSEVVVFVNVRIDSLNEVSKLIESNIKTPERINKLIKKEIKIKKDNLILSVVILLFV